MTLRHCSRNSLRPSKPMSRHQIAARRAFSTAASTSSALWIACSPTTSPVRGSSDSNVGPSRTGRDEIGGSPAPNSGPDSSGPEGLAVIVTP